MTVVYFIYAVFIAALTASQYYGSLKAERWLKPIASLGFIVMALLGGAIYSPAGLILLWGLIACAVGDMCLLSRTRLSLFRFGMAAFALGHIFYSWAFLSGPHNPVLALLGVFVCALLCGFVYRWLKDDLPADMKLPILVYMGIISIMVAAAISSAKPIYIAGALLFAASDIFVARDRFVKDLPQNALIITPLYYVAQGLFAYAASIG